MGGTGMPDEVVTAPTYTWPVKVADVWTGNEDRWNRRHFIH